METIFCQNIGFRLIERRKKGFCMKRKKGLRETFGVGLRIDNDKSAETLTVTGVWEGKGERVYIFTRKKECHGVG